VAYMLTSALTPTVGTMAVALPREGTYMLGPSKH
jgi:hypothetical protein